MPEWLTRAEEVSKAYHDYLRACERLTSFGSYSVGVDRISRERKRQMDEEHYTADHDAQHVRGELVAAAIAYAHASVDIETAEIHWPWLLETFKPSDSPVRNLERAGALIAAEIDRLYLAEAETALRVTVEGLGK